MVIKWQILSARKDLQHLSWYRKNAFIKKRRNVCENCVKSWQLGFKHNNLLWPNLVIHTMTVSYVRIAGLSTTVLQV